MNYLTSNDLLPPRQSGFHHGHSTESAVLHVLSEVLLAVNRGNFAALALLDLSAAFDMVDYNILLQRLQDKLRHKRLSSAVVSVVPSWSNSTCPPWCHYIVGGSSRMWRSSGFCVGPFLFLLYTADLIALVKSYGLSPHLYADDTQIYGSCSPSHVDTFLSVVTDCVNAVADWMRSNRLQLNSDKTEFMWCATVRRQHSLPTVGPFIGSSTVTLSSAIRDLGVYTDSGLTTQSQVRKTVSRCFAVLRKLRTVRRQVPTSVFKSFIVALVLSRLDYCNSVLFGLPANLIHRHHHHIRLINDLSTASITQHK